MRSTCTRYALFLALLLALVALLTACGSAPATFATGEPPPTALPTPNCAASTLAITDKALATPRSEADADVITGPPSLSPQQITVILEQYCSQMRSMGQLFYDEGVKANIDPAVLLGLYVLTGGSQAEVRAGSANFLGLRCRETMRRCMDGYAIYDTHQEAMSDTYSLLNDVYIPAGRTTLEDAARLFLGSPDEAASAAVLGKLADLVAEWRAQPAG